MFMYRNNIKMSVLPNQNPSKSGYGYEKTAQFIWSSKRPRGANTVLKQKKKAGGQTPSHFKTYDKAIIIKAVWYWQKKKKRKKKNRSMEQNRGPRNRPTKIFAIRIME